MKKDDDTNILVTKSSSVVVRSGIFSADWASKSELAVLTFSLEEPVEVNLPVRLLPVLRDFLATLVEEVDDAKAALAPLNERRGESQSGHPSTLKDYLERVADPNLVDPNPHKDSTFNRLRTISRAWQIAVSTSPLPSSKERLQEIREAYGDALAASQSLDRLPVVLAGLVSESTRVIQKSLVDVDAVLDNNFQGA